MSKKIRLDKEAYAIDDEWYGLLWKCTECGEVKIWGDFSFCPICGVKIEWEG